MARKVGREPTREAICAATEHLLREGVAFPDLSVSAVLTEADVSRRTFYLYFASKRAVLAALTGTYLVELAERVGGWLDRDDLAPRERVERLTHGWVAFHRERAHVLVAAADQWPYSSQVAEAYEEAMGWMVQRTAQRIATDRLDGRTHTTADPGRLASGLVWSTERMLVVHARDAGPWASDDALVETLTAIWCGTLYQRAALDQEQTRSARR